MYLEIAPPFSAGWARRLESVGAIPIGDALRQRLGETPEDELRRTAWGIARDTANRAREVGFAGMVLMGLRFETAVDEAFAAWHAG